MLSHYLDDLDADLKASLQEQLTTLWTHTSTALEGNSLTLGETHQVLTAGLTISGKPLKDHNEVVGHARAEALLEGFVSSGNAITVQNIFDLHTAVQTSMTCDVYTPIGAYKNQPNSTVIVIGTKQIVNDTYAYPGDVAVFMQAWINKLNQTAQKSGIQTNRTLVLDAYTWLHAAFVRIHPFADGNGRLARLLANIPVLASGQPPILIPKEKRLEYIQHLAKWQISLGRPSPHQALVVENSEYKNFRDFCDKSWEPTQQLVEEIRKLQAMRQQKQSASECSDDE